MCNKTFIKFNLLFLATVHEARSVYHNDTWCLQRSYIINYKTSDEDGNRPETARAQRTEHTRDWPRCRLRAKLSAKFSDKGCTVIRDKMSWSFDVRIQCWILNEINLLKPPWWTALRYSVYYVFNIESK